MEEICGEGWNHDSDYEHGKGLIRARLRNKHTMAVAFPPAFSPHLALRLVEQHICPWPLLCPWAEVSSPLIEPDEIAPSLWLSYTKIHCIFLKT